MIVGRNDGIESRGVGPIVASADEILYASARGNSSRYV
jgi:hypothetical protein